MKQHDNSEVMRLADYARGDEYQRAADDAVDLIRQQAERIAELEAERDNLHATMFAAAVEIQAHWEAHCDAEGYGPANLMHRLERGIASLYGYDAKTLQRVETERDQLRAEVERLRADGERLDWIEHQYLEDLVMGLAVDCEHDGQYYVRGDDNKTGYGDSLRAAIDAARTHKETE